MNRKYYNQKDNRLRPGFTLIEILLYLGIFTILIGAIIPFAWTVIQMGQKSAVQQEVFNNARFVSEKLKRQIRDAQSVNTGASNFGVNLVTNPSYKITLVLPSPDTAAVISVANGKVLVAKNGGAAEALNSTGSRVTELTATNYSGTDGRADNISILLTMEGLSGVAGKTYTAQTQLITGAEMRN